MPTHKASSDYIVWPPRAGSLSGWAIFPHQPVRVFLQSAQTAGNSSFRVLQSMLPLQSSIRWKTSSRSRSQRSRRSMSRILIVEDDPSILCGLRDNLEFESHQVLTATDGEAGYRTLREHAPDLVILDLMLPKLSGYDLCRRVR